MANTETTPTVPAPNARESVIIPDILLPAQNIDMTIWPVIACDQFTQDRAYWETCEALANGKPSTLHITLPEVYLNDADKAGRIARIKRTMDEYRKTAFAEPCHAFVYVERTTAYGRTRKGLVAAIDLETYDWKPFSTNLIRATEATIVERIPPRMEIRKGAALETPHIMLLVNDPEAALVEAAGDRAKKRSSSMGVPPLYDTMLMQNGGSITGWAVETDYEVEQVYAAIERIAQAQTQADGSSFLFAVGDGNHSLATAKAVWDEFKAAHTGEPELLKDHPVRYALVEIVNIYDEGLTFEPIHRVLFNVDGDTLCAALAEKLCAVKAGTAFGAGTTGGKAETASSGAAGTTGGALRQAQDTVLTATKAVETAAELEAAVSASGAAFGIVFTASDGTAQYRVLRTAIPESALLVSHLQPVLDEFLADAERASLGAPGIDYIHGSAEVFRLAKEPGTVCLLLPPIAKDAFFSTIAQNGPLPRKSFSMGEASEKRYYLECRALF